MSCPRARVHPEVGFDSIVPGIIVERPPSYPLVVAHRHTPAKKWYGIWSYGMPELPCPANGDLEHLFGHHRWRHRVRSALLKRPAARCGGDARDAPWSMLMCGAISVSI